MIGEQESWWSLSCLCHNRPLTFEKCIITDLFWGFRGCAFKGSQEIQMCKFDLMTVQGRSIEFNCSMIIFFRLHSLKKNLIYHLDSFPTFKESLEVDGKQKIKNYNLPQEKTSHCQNYLNPLLNSGLQSLPNYWLWFIFIENQSSCISSVENKVLYNNPTHFSKKGKFALSSPKIFALSSLQKSLPAFFFFSEIKLWNQISHPARLHEVQAGSLQHTALLTGDIVLFPYKKVRNKISLLITFNYSSSFWYQRICI